MPNYKVSSNDLKTVADAIRTKGGTSESLSFPTGFAEAIANIPTGQEPTLITKSITENGVYSASVDDADGYSSVTVDVEDARYEFGSFTCPSSGDSFTLNFNKTYSKYFVLIEATDNSKAEIIASGSSSAKSFAFVGIYPQRVANNATVNVNTLCQRIKPASSETDGGSTSTFVYSSTSMILPMINIGGGANYVYRGLTYNYYIVVIK